MNCSEILETIEYKTIDANERIAKLVIAETLSKTNKHVALSGEYFIQKLNYLKKNYIYNSEHLESFFEIMERYGYNPKHEIINAVNRLGNLPNPKKNSELIHNLINSPYINDINYNGKGFDIFSSQFGTINFTLASYRYKHNKNMVRYIKENPLPGRCHNHTLFIRAIFPYYYAVTALCPAPFTGKYYHSFSYDSANHSIIDLCSNAVFSLNQYEKLFEPDVISIVLNSNISEELKITKKKTNQPLERQALLKIALYKQLLTMQVRENNPNSPKILTLKNVHNKTPR